MASQGGCQGALVLKCRHCDGPKAPVSCISMLHRTVLMLAGRCRRREGVGRRGCLSIPLQATAGLQRSRMVSSNQAGQVQSQEFRGARGAPSSCRCGASRSYEVGAAGAGPRAMRRKATRCWGRGRIYSIAAGYEESNPSELDCCTMNVCNVLYGLVTAC